MRQVFQKSITVLLFSMLYITVCHAFEVNGIEYYVVSESARTVAVTKNNLTQYSGDIVIPSKITYQGKTYTVTEIANSAFSYCHAVTSVSLPNQLVSIGSSAFQECKSLKSVTFPESLKEIDSDAFKYCEELNVLSLPKSVTEIGDRAFAYCTKLSSIYYNAENANSSYSHNWIFNQAGTDGTGLTITIGKDVKVIPSSMFGQQSQNIYGNTVRDNKQIVSIVFEDGCKCTKIESYAFMGCSGVTDVVLPNTVTEIDFVAFEYCSGMESITLPESLKKIDSNAFSYCRSLQSITIPANVEYIGCEAFVGCDGLTEINYNAENAVYNIGYSDWGAFSLGRSIPVSVKIGKDVQSIPDELFAYYGTSDEPVNLTFENGSICSYVGKRAFAGLGGLTHVELPNSVTSTVQPFYSTGITEPVYTSNIFFYLPKNTTGEYEIPEGVVTIVSDAAKDCANLTKIILPKSLTTIKDYSFKNAKGLTSILIPKNVTSIENDAFYGCNNLKTVYNASSLPIVVGKTAYGYVAYYATKVISGYSYTLYNGNSEKNVGTGLLPDIVSAMTSSNSIAFVDDEIVEALPNNIVKMNGSGNLEALTIELNDATNVYCPSNVHVENIYHIRNFTNTNWQALYIPFSMNYADWSDDFEVARINDVHQFDNDNDGTIDETKVELIRVANGSIEPNTPYLIKAKSVGEKTITLSNTTLYTTEKKSYDVTSWNTKFTFTGTYHTIPGSEMESNGYYAMGDGKLVQAQDATANLGAFRWYLSVTDRDGNPKNVNEVKMMFIGFDDDEEETVVEGITVDNIHQTAAVYDLNGTKVDGKNLKAGIYIKNGKKLVVK